MKSATDHELSAPNAPDPFCSIVALNPYRIAKFDTFRYQPRFTQSVFMRQRIFRWLIRCSLVLVLLGLLVVGYFLIQARKMPAGHPEYVAMGSSFAAGPGIRPRTSDTPSFCFQSDENYAHQVARLQHLSLVDMSCGGATSEHILNGGLLFQGPQLRAVTSETRLVTITIGGNDVSYLGDLIALGCRSDTSIFLRLLGACKPSADNTVEAGFERLARNLRDIVAGIRKRAPQARVVLITYPAILPESGTCLRLGLSELSADKMRITAARLEATTRAVAREMGVEVVEAGTFSREHNVCAAEPWINSAHGNFALLHPNLAGMNALAGEIERILRNPAAVSESETNKVERNSQ
jgi:lysophospholipase L1-like esterase